MASEAGKTFSAGLQKIQQTLGGNTGPKAADLAGATRDYNDPKARITTDYGVLQSNTGRIQRICIKALC